MKHPNKHTKAEDWFAQGTACAARGQHGEALVWFERVRKALPAAPAVYHQIGMSLAALNRLPDALASCRRACTMAPAIADFHHGRAWVLEQMNRFEEAAEGYRKAAQINPLAGNSLNNLGNCLQVLGKFDEAHEAYRRAINAAPDNALYYYNFVPSTRLRADDPCFAGMEKLLQRIDGLPQADQARLHFAYGQALSDTGQNDRGFEHFLKANALQRPMVGYNEAATLQSFNLIPSLFTAQLLKEKSGLGDSSQTPVFIIGMPRSGSSLVEQILASHPQVFGAGERPDFGLALLNFIAQEPNQPGKIDQNALHNLSAIELAPLGAEYLSRVDAAMPQARSYARVANKYPFNFINVGLIHLALPNARFIHTRRAPLETCLSIFSRIFHDVPFGYDLGELGRYYRAYDMLMAHWQSVLPEGVMLDVQYEELVDDFEPQVRRMLSHCGLDWDERCLAFHKTERQVNTASASQVRKPLFRSALKRWRPEPALLQPLLDGLGPALPGNQTGDA